MRFSLDVLRARKGDCLMLHYGTDDEPRLMLIDGGPSSVFVPHLLPRIKEVHEAFGLDETQALPVDVVLVSHIDDDHIRGILDLTKDQLGNNPDLRLRVESLWHNTFDDLLKTSSAKLLSGLGQDALASLASNGHDPAFDDIDVEDADDEEVDQAVDVLASISQGLRLRDDREALEKKSGMQRQWRLNHGFDGQLILTKGKADPVELDGGLKITVAGPMQQELDDLHEECAEWMREHQAGQGKTAESMLAAFVDTSVPNLSSIVLFVEVEGKSMLLTGDARGDRILQGLELAGVLEAEGTRSIDILKVPHHGSDNNMTQGFFERLPARHYVFSGNGEHGNPERETLKMLRDARGAAADYEIHLTYPISEIDRAREEEWNNQQGREKKRKLKNPKTKKQVREDWSAKKHSLEEFFKGNPEMAKKLRFVKADEPHLIDLLDKVSLKPE